MLFAPPKTQTRKLWNNDAGIAKQKRASVKKFFTALNHRGILSSSFENDRNHLSSKRRPVSNHKMKNAKKDSQIYHGFRLSITLDTPLF
jgi:hypothetical protein